VGGCDRSHNFKLLQTHFGNFGLVTLITAYSRAGNFLKTLNWEQSQLHSIIFHRPCVFATNNEYSPVRQQPKTILQAWQTDVPPVHSLYNADRQHWNASAEVVTQSDQPTARCSLAYLESLTVRPMDPYTTTA